MTRSGLADGCFADAANVTGLMDNWALDNQTAAAWVAGHQRALESLSEQLQPDGFVIANGGPSEFARGFMMEVFKPDSDGIRQIQSGVTDGRINQVPAEWRIRCALL